MARIDGIVSGIVTPPRAQAPAADLAWRRLTAAANRHFAGRDDMIARDLYAQALAEAERLFDLAVGGGDVEAAVIYNVSCQNAADLETTAGDTVAAITLLNRALDRLASAAASMQVTPGFRRACAQNLKFSLAAVLQQLRATDGSEADAARAIDTARRAALRALGDTDPSSLN